jgi:hypothetical protein
MKRFVAVLLVAGALLVPAGAFASSTCQGYGESTACTLKQDASADATKTTSAATTSQGTLPFTGLDVVLLAVGGSSLLGAGLVVRRLSRRLN